MRTLIILIMLSLWLVAGHMENEGIKACESRGHSTTTCLAAFGIR